ncbi:hypothetical protein D3C73_1625690 [compost metagenome]
MNSAIFDANPKGIPFIGRGHEDGRPFRCIANRVGEKIDQYLLDAAAIRHNFCRCQPGEQLELPGCQLRR